MPLIERYILRRTTQAFLVAFGALVATLWLTQVLRELDVVTTKGQAIWVFLVMTVLALPALSQVIVPIAFLVAVILTLSTLNNDSELPVIAGAGASRATIARPILLLAGVLTLALVISYHIVAPASLSALRALVSRVHAEVIATLVKDGGFRTVDEGLTIHIRQKTADGAFADIFVSDDRNPQESLQYTAARGILLDRPGGSYLVLQEGDLIRENRVRDENNVVAFDSHAVDLSRIGAPAVSSLYKAKERSTFYLLSPAADDPFPQRFPQRLAAELHDRMTAPFYVLAFAVIALLFLGRPRTSRQDRSYAVAAVVLICLLVRAAGFGAAAAAGWTPAAIPLLYAVPLAAIAIGAYAGLRDARLAMPAVVEAGWDGAAAAVQRLGVRVLPAPRGAGASRR
jgi:lipopolysaccharide export system permease protein